MSPDSSVGILGWAAEEQVRVPEYAEMDIVRQVLARA
jgi:hypothetical protein